MDSARESVEERAAAVTIGSALTNPWLTIRVQLALGVIFVVAALPKIVDPPSFAHMVYNYRLLPAAAINFFALVLPWLELLTGLCLVLGIWKRTATLITVALLVVFIAGISLNLARGNAIDCGCFDVSAANRTREQRLTDMKLVIARDIGLLLMAGQLLYATRQRFEPEMESGSERVPSHS